MFEYDRCLMRGATTEGACGSFFEMRHGSLRLTARFQVARELRADFRDASCPSLLEPRRDARVQTSPAHRRHAVAKHALVQEVVEAIRPRHGPIRPLARTAGHYHQPFAGQASQALFDVDRVRGERRSDERRGESAADEASGFERRAIGIVEPLDVRCDELAQAWGYACGERRRVTLQHPSAVDVHDGAVGSEVVGDADEEERVAVGTLVQHGRQGGRAREVGPPRFQVRRNARLGQRCQPNVAAPAVIPQVLVQLAQRMAAHGHLDRPIGADEHQPREIAALRQRRHDVERGTVAPVEVFEEQHERRRENRHQCGDLAQHAFAAGHSEPSVECFAFRRVE